MRALLLAAFALCASACAPRGRPPLASASAQGAGLRLERRTVRGQSMTGLFEGGEEVLLAVGYYATRRPERGDVVVYRGRSALLKSVRAVEGDRFAVRREGAQLRLVLQGEVARTSRGEPYSLDETAGRILGLYERDYGGVVPRGACLLLGNTPTGSYDSTRLGLVSVADLEGRVLARVRR